jgi:hypothetical protein
MSTDEKIFADGFSFKRSENAPDFVIGRISMKADEAIAFIRKHEKRGWVNLNVKTARSGNHYIELDTYEPKGAAATGDTSEKQEAPMPSKTATKTKKAPASGEPEELLPF